jgi:hypothetical protein
MEMIIEFYTVNIFVKEAFITSVGSRRAGPGGPSQLTGRTRPGWVKQRLGRAGLRNSWAATGRAEPEKIAQFRGLICSLLLSGGIVIVWVPRGWGYGWWRKIRMKSLRASVGAEMPRSNMHGRKRPFTVKNGDIRRSYTGSVHGHRIRSETMRNGYRIRRSYKKEEWFKGNGFYSVYGAIRLPYTIVYYCVLPYTVVYGYSMGHFSDSHWKWVSI